MFLPVFLPLVSWAGISSSMAKAPFLTLFVCAWVRPSKTPQRGGCASIEDAPPPGLPNQQQPACPMGFYHVGVAPAVLVSRT